MTTRRAVVLVDGEHYPPVIRAALGDLRRSGTEPVLALFLGGTEKVSRHGADVDLGVPVEWVPPDEDAGSTLSRVLDRLGPDVVVDCSDDPVVDGRVRLRLAGVVLAAGVSYEGADFRFTPPARPRLAAQPSIAVIGTGKRTGKTAVTGEIARLLVASGRTPVAVAMGRGGPADPVVVPAGSPLDVHALLAVADAGGHAASDFYENAATAGITTVGAWRCGGGLAGGVGACNVGAAVEVAGGLGGDMLLLEGSGAAIPPAHADATVLVAPGDADPELIAGYLGSYRVLLADLVVVTMCEPPRASADQVEAVQEAIRSVSRRVPCLRTVFRPVPLEPVSGARVFFATTAPAAVGAALVSSLEERTGCEVVGLTPNLADRELLVQDMRAAPRHDVLLVELKAAAVDVAARVATEDGARVVFCDNQPVVVPGGPGDPDEELGDAVRRLARIADERFAA